MIASRIQMGAGDPGTERRPPPPCPGPRSRIPYPVGIRVDAGFGNNQVIDRSKRKELEKGVSLIGKSIHFELE